jgi:Uncharacterized ACR, COG1678
MDRASTWYEKAQSMIDHKMEALHDASKEDGQINPSELDEESKEILQMYLEYQDSWQHVCLVLEQDEEAGTATTLVLNRPMAVRLTDHLGRLVLDGAYVTTMDGVLRPSEYAFHRFMKAFRNECAVYIGGPDEQEEPATVIHGIAGLEGAVEIAPGTGIYCGGLDAAIVGVLEGKYKPLDFRFFIGKNLYEDFTLVYACVSAEAVLAVAQTIVA